MELAEVCSTGERILDEVERAVVGKRDVLELVLLGLLADGHVLLEDVPGLAKTLIARSFAQATSLSFSRIQFTPDLMPSDVTGSSIFNQRTADFEFRPGPVFANLAARRRDQPRAAENAGGAARGDAGGQVTTEGDTRPLAPPFLVLATQNPIEYEGTYPLPEAQLDRFLLRTQIGYPAREDEWQVLARRLDRGEDEVSSSPSSTRRGCSRCSARSSRCTLPSRSGSTWSTSSPRPRASTRLQIGSSPRGTLALLKLSRAKATLAGRDFVTPDDVKAIAVPALAHRLTLRPELWVQRVRGEDIVREALDSVPTPAAEDARPDAKPNSASGRVRRRDGARAGRRHRPGQDRARRPRRAVRAPPGPRARARRRPERARAARARPEPRARGRRRHRHARPSPQTSRSGASTCCSCSRRVSPRNR